jgi:hypothetical protein
MGATNALPHGRTFAHGGGVRKVGVSTDRRHARLKT